MGPHQEGLHRRRDPRGRPHVRLPPFGLRLHERPAAGHRRVDRRQPVARCQQPHADPGITDITMLTLLAMERCADGPRGHQAHGRAGRAVRLRLPRRRRNAGRRRPERGLGLRDHAGRAPVDPEERQARRGLGGGARPGRRSLGLPERIADRRDRPRPTRTFHGLGRTSSPYAVEAGLYDPKSGKPFSWKRAYNPAEASAVT